MFISLLYILIEEKYPGLFFCYLSIFYRKTDSVYHMVAMCLDNNLRSSCPCRGYQFSKHPLSGRMDVRLGIFQ